MKTRCIGLLSVCLLALLFGRADVTAQEDPAPAPIETEETGETQSPADSVLDAWDGLQTAEAENQKLRDAVSGLFQKMETDEGKAAAREVFMTALKKGGTMVWEAENAFREAFDESDWSKWEGEEHAELFKRGLGLSARYAIDHEPKHALAAWEKLIEKFPDSGEADYARTTWLPIALPAAGDYEHALKRLRELKDEVEEASRPGMRMAIGDVYAMQGEFEKARAEYQGALDDIAKVGEFEKYDRRLSVRRYCKLRVALIGKEAPEVDSKTWIGGEAKKLSDLHGQVVVLDYWATW